ncbi:pheST operon leader peptide PheM [Erwinia endophytica]|nr:pheST operon leader peptide PheM [Erwinia endophytica]
MSQAEFTRQQGNASMNAAIFRFFFDFST